MSPVNFFLMMFTLLLKQIIFLEYVSTKVAGGPKVC